MNESLSLRKREAFPKDHSFISKLMNLIINKNGSLGNVPKYLTKRGSVLILRLSEILRFHPKIPLNRLL